ncbi:MAG: hypothetical protein KJO07_25670, partial [Deltaproteobacteria bacterium]|nr:hypothetical protein [Deltaproteobacteria bacterium]
PMGCPRSDLSDRTLDFRSKGRTQRAIGIAAYAVGGATVITGVVLSVLNRPETMERTTFAVTPQSFHLQVSF